ncbi:MAG TPA: hypothetical protein VKD67_11430 [Acidimicrobiales bacterium]|nr:hypothetical protein [Acidimicrobiales bacterium]
MTATAVGPAYAGVGATIQLAFGLGPAQVASFNASALAPAAAVGPVTVTVAGVAVSEWDVASCPPGPSCTIPTGTTSIEVGLDLTGVAAGAQVPVTVTSTADGASPGRAAVTVPALARPAGLEHFAVDRGAVAMAANTVIACEPAPGDPCDPNNNNEKKLGRISVGPGDFDSSSADLHLPAGATVRYALLQWGGNPAAAPDPKKVGTVALTTPNGRSVTVNAAMVRRAGDRAYTARADVTSIVRGLADANGTYTVADVQTGDGPGQFGGWALIVAYHQPDVPRRAIAVFDDPSAAPGVLTPVNEGADVVYSLAGIAAPATAADVQLGVVGYEGDRSIASETVTVGTVKAGDPEDNNFFSSSIAVGGATRFPSNDNQYGFDAHLLTVPKAFAPGDTGPKVTVHVGSGKDLIYLGAVSVVVSL